MSEEIQERYLYTVYPKKPIRNLNENLSIVRVPRSLYLSKDEVLKCLECGSVYRRFSNEGKVEKIHKYELDRVHRAEYISAEEWNKIQEKVGKVENLKVNGIESEPTNDDTSVTPSKKELGRGQTDPIMYFTDEPILETSTSEYVEVIEEDGKPVDNTIPDSITTTNNDTMVEIEYKDLANQASEQISEEISTNTEETSDIDESENEADVEVEDSDELEADSEENEEDSSNTDNSTANKTVVNYGKKKKHHH